MFRALEGRHTIGTAAEIISMEEPKTLNEKLSQIDQWEQIPAYVLVRAFHHGASLSAMEKTMTLKEMDALASHMAQAGDDFIVMVTESVSKDFSRKPQIIAWTRALVFAAIRTCDWKNIPQGQKTVQAFICFEQCFLTKCYQPDVLQEDAILLLPPMHRFGWYCIRAFDAMDAGDTAGYVRLLRIGLETYKNMKSMVEFLLENTPNLQTPPEPTEELKALADQIRAVLSNFSPDNPAVEALKQSEAYQKVAYLIDGAEVPVVGGVVQ